MMKLDKDEAALFELLSKENSTSGKTLKKFFEHLIAHYGDVRTMEHDDVQARRDALVILEKEVVDRLKMKKEKKQVINGNKFN